MGVGPVPGLLLPEIFTNRIRAKAVAFCMSVHWVIHHYLLSKKNNFIITDYLDYVEAFYMLLNLVSNVFSSITELVFLP